MLLRTCIFVLAILTLAAFAPAQSPAPKQQTRQPGPGASIEGKVVSVENGDTIMVKADGDESDTYQVKLHAVDAPDIGQPYYENARKSLSKLILKKDVTVKIQNAYARDMIIGTVYRDGRDIGLELVEKGFAWHFKRFANQQPAGERKSYADAQEYASTAGRGLWSDDRPTPPWVFRGEVDQANAPGFTETGSNNKELPAGDVLKTSATTPARPVTVSKPSSASTSRKYILGPRGGCYYIAESGSKVYVKDKTLCGVASTEKP
jgi:endonuclease YncB( thermonuclease family)